MREHADMLTIVISEARGDDIMQPCGKSWFVKYGGYVEICSV